MPFTGWIPITAGIVSSSKGSLTVDGSHTYALPPLLTVTVTLADDAPGTAVASVSGAVPPISMTHQVNVLEGGSVSAASLGDGNVTVTAINGGTVGSPDMGSFGTLTLNANDSYSYTANNIAAINAAPAGSHPTDTFTYTVTVIDPRLSVAAGVRRAQDRSGQAPEGARVGE